MRMIKRNKDLDLYKVFNLKGMDVECVQNLLRNNFLKLDGLDERVKNGNAWINDKLVEDIKSTCGKFEFSDFYYVSHIITDLSDSVFEGKDGDCLKHILRQYRNFILNGIFNNYSPAIEILYYLYNNIIEINDDDIYFTDKIEEITDMIINSISIFHNYFPIKFSTFQTNEHNLSGEPYDYDNLDTIYKKLNVD